MFLLCLVIAILFVLLMCAAQVNSYPTVRGFTAIGTGGEDFVQAMVVAVESVIQQPIPQVCIHTSTHFRRNLEIGLICWKIDALIYSMIYV